MACTTIGYGWIGPSLRFQHLGLALFALVLFHVPYRAAAILIHPGKLNAGLVKIHIGVCVLLMVALLVNWTIYLGGIIP